MTISNNIINVTSASSSSKSEKEASKVSNLGTLNNKSDMSQLIVLRHSAAEGVTNIFANCPPNFNLELQAEWGQKNGAGTLKDVAGLAAGRTRAGSTRAGQAAVDRVMDATGYGATTLKYLTAHYWEGSAPIRCTIPFEFIAEDNPDLQVIKPLVHLYKMAAPLEWNGMLIPPGPSMLGTALTTGERITIQIGNMMTFSNVIINSVSGEIDTRLSFDDKIMHVKVDVSFTSFFTASRKDIVDIFGGVGGDSESVGVT